MHPRVLILTAVAVILMTAGAAQADVREGGRLIFKGNFEGEKIELKYEKGKLVSACMILDDGRVLVITDGDHEPSIKRWSEVLEMIFRGRDRFCVKVEDYEMKIVRKQPKPAKAAAA